jgi:hypothetical protein
VDARGWRDEAGQDGEAGDGDEWDREGFAEALGGAEADADSGEGAGAVDYGDCGEGLRSEAAVGEEGFDGGNEAFGGGAAGEGCGGEGCVCVGQGDGAGCAAGVD